jgi:hypothetical protein
MKQYSSSYTPEAFKRLCGIRNVDLDAVERAIDSLLVDCQTQAKSTFQGVRRIAKVDYAASETLAELPAGSVRDCLFYFRDVKRAEKQAKRAIGVITLTDFPANLVEWFGKFTKPATETEAKPKADKSKGKAQPATASV